MCYSWKTVTSSFAFMVFSNPQGKVLIIVGILCCPNLRVQREQVKEKGSIKNNLKQPKKYLKLQKKLPKNF